MKNKPTVWYDPKRDKLAIQYLLKPDRRWLGLEFIFLKIQVEDVSIYFETHIYPGIDPYKIGYVYIGEL